MLHAMTSGHDGSFTTLHASGPRLVLNRLQMLAMSADPHLAPVVVNQMIGSGVDMVVHLGTYQRGDQAVRRLASLAVVDHNLEDPMAGPLLQEFCRYRVRDDSWEWEPESFRFMPKKVEDKFAMAGIETARLFYRLAESE